jgi:hypothetical protein
VNMSRRRAGFVRNKRDHFRHLLRFGWDLWLIGLWACRLHYGFENACEQWILGTCPFSAGLSELFAAASQITSLYI